MILSLNCSCLIPFLVCCFRSSVQIKQLSLWEQGVRKLRGGSWVLGDLLSRNTCGRRSSGGRGVLPCRSGYPEQPRANHYHLASPSMFTAAPGLNGFHMAPRHLRHNLYNTQTHRDTHSQDWCTHTRYTQLQLCKIMHIDILCTHTFCTHFSTYDHKKAQVQSTYSHEIYTNVVKPDL